MEIAIFIAMASAILYLLWDNRRLETISRVATKAAIKEQMKRKTLEVMIYGTDLDNEDIFDDDTLYED